MWQEAKTAENIYVVENPNVFVSQKYWILFQLTVTYAIFHFRKTRPIRKNMVEIRSKFHISHGRGVVAALRRNQFDPQLAWSARNSLTFPASYLWVKLEV